MDDSLYDEFGNYIGPELSDSDAESDEGPEEGSQEERGSDEDMEVRHAACSVLTSGGSSAYLPACLLVCAYSGHRG